jgi:hypothetical protein
MGIMNTRTFPTIIGVVLAVALLGLIFTKGQELGRLRTERQQLLARLDAPENSASTPQAPAASRATLGGGDDDSNELLRLRNEVNQLNRRKQELSGVIAENQKLKATLASAPTNSGVKLPPGYIHKNQARMAGFATPENTIESLLWAIQNRDVNSLLQAFAPEAAKRIQDQISGTSPQQFFDNSVPLPGLAILKSERMPDGTVQLIAEIAPGIPAVPLRLQQIDGQWKISMPLF